jgi:hypothetical protein
VSISMHRSTSCRRPCMATAADASATVVEMTVRRYIDVGDPCVVYRTLITGLLHTGFMRNLPGTCGRALAALAGLSSTPEARNSQRPRTSNEEGACWFCTTTPGGASVLPRAPLQQKLLLRGRSRTAS